MSQVDMNRLTLDILNWSEERGLDKGNPQGQMLKLMEEVGETAEAMNKNSIVDFMDGIGDIYVVLAILCQQRGIHVENCAFHAYHEIKDRTGAMQNGVFVKEGDIID